MAPKAASTFPPLERHGLRHGERHRITARGSDESKRDSGVSAGRFNQFLSRLQDAALFRVPDHRRANPALHRVRGIASFDLAEQRHRRAIDNAIQSD